jgi:hypothetical protein
MILPAIYNWSSDPLRNKGGATGRLHEVVAIYLEV